MKSMMVDAISVHRSGVDDVGGPENWHRVDYRGGVDDGSGAYDGDGADHGDSADHRDGVDGRCGHHCRVSDQRGSDESGSGASQQGGETQLKNGTCQQK
jgi:hypothetical protein